MLLKQNENATSCKWCYCCKTWFTMDPNALIVMKQCKEKYWLEINANGKTELTSLLMIECYRKMPDLNAKDYNKIYETLHSDIDENKLRGYA